MSAVVTVPSSARARVSIIVVSGPRSALLERCLACLAASAPAIALEVIVVLTGGGEERAAAVRAGLVGVTVVPGEVNLGIAAALNRGRTLARGELLVSLHDDAEAQPGWLETLVGAVDADPGAGAVGSMAVRMDGVVQAAGWELLPDGQTRAPWPAGEPVGPAVLAARSPRAVDYCGSSSLLVRAATWDAIGGADERLFPVYYVDVDLCLAVRAHGQRVLCAPGSVIHHHVGASTRLDFAHFVSGRNRVLMLEKWGSRITAHVPGSGAIGDGRNVPRPTCERDRERQDRIQLQRALAVSTAYADDLYRRLGEVTAYAEDLRPRLDEATRHAEDLRRQLDAAGAG